MEGILQSILGAITGLAVFCVGLPWQLLIVYAMLLIIDVATGVLKAAKNNEWSSSKMKGGLIKKALEILLLFAVLILQFAANTIGIPVPLGSIIIGIFCFKDFGSILENCIQAGYNIPPAIKKWFNVATVMLDEAAENNTTNNKDNK